MTTRGSAEVSRYKERSEATVGSCFPELQSRKLEKHYLDLFQYSNVFFFACMSCAC